MSKENIKRWCRTYNGWLFAANLVFAIINLIVAICCLLPCSSKDCCLSSCEVIVGIFSLLVTVLIGWNIFSVIDFKAHTEEMKKNSNKVELMSMAFSNLTQQYYKDMGESEAALVEMELSIYHNKKPEERLPIIVFHGLRATVWSARGGNIENANGLLFALFFELNRADGFIVPESLLKDMVANINYLEQIEGVAKTDVFKGIKEIIMGCSNNQKGQQ